ncbi:Protein nen1 [Orobanche minor]
MIFTPELAVFSNLETTVPKLKGGRFAILVCPQKLEELRSYSTLVRPADLSCIDSLCDRHNGITKEAVVTAPTFADIADDVYNLLDGRIWAGHNILRFDCHRIKETFDEINKPAPKPKGINSLIL